jgi:hypothetical protein
VKDAYSLSSLSKNVHIKGEQIGIEKAQKQYRTALLWVGSTKSLETFPYRELSGLFHKQTLCE